MVYPSYKSIFVVLSAIVIIPNLVPFDLFFGVLKGVAMGAIFLPVVLFNYLSSSNLFTITGMQTVSTSFAVILSIPHVGTTSYFLI